MFDMAKATVYEKMKQGDQAVQVYEEILGKVERKQDGYERLRVARAQQQGQRPITPIPPLPQFSIRQSVPVLQQQLLVQPTILLSICNLMYSLHHP